MATATITVDLEEHGISIPTAGPAAVAENFLDLMVAQRAEMIHQVIRVKIDGTETDVVLADGTETPVA